MYFDRDTVNKGGRDRNTSIIVMLLKFWRRTAYLHKHKLPILSMYKRKKEIEKKKKKKKLDPI